MRGIPGGSVSGLHLYWAFPSSLIARIPFLCGLYKINKLCWHHVICPARVEAETGFLCVFGIHLELLILQSLSPASQAYTTTPSLGSVCLRHRHDEVINARVLIALSSVARLSILFLSSSSCRLDLCSLYLAQERDLCWVPLPWSLLCPLGHFFLRQALRTEGRKELIPSPKKKRWAWVVKGLLRACIAICWSHV